MRSFLGALFEYIRASSSHYIGQPTTKFINRVVERLDTWARQETARALSDENEAPEVTAKRMGSVIIRSIPFMRPMFIHILAIFLFGMFLTFLFTFAGLLRSDLWDNKMMVNDKLQPAQAFFLFVDKTYLRSEFLDEQELQVVNERGFEGDKLTVDQRKTIRNRMLIWFFVGDILGIFLAFLLRYYPAWVW